MYNPRIIPKSIQLKHSIMKAKTFSDHLAMTKNVT